MILCHNLSKEKSTTGVNPIEILFKIKQAWKSFSNYDLVNKLLRNLKTLCGNDAELTNNFLVSYSL